jgi:hypothetical protein
MALNISHAYAIALGLSLLFGAEFAFAGNIVLPSDVSVDLSAAPTQELTPGEAIDVVVTVTNHGPEDLPAVIVHGQRYVNEIELLSVDSNECFVYIVVEDLNNGFDYLITWMVANEVGGTAPILHAGEVRTCHMQLALTDAAPAVYTLSFGLLTPLFSDPNPANDQSSVELRREGSTTIALPATSTIGAWLLGLFLASFAGIELAGRGKFSHRCSPLRRRASS